MSLALAPASADRLGPGALLALLVHAGLLVALTLSVQWRRHDDAVFAAELWSALPEVAAPPAPVPAPVPAPAPTPAPPPAPAVAAPPPPPPGPTAAEIALEREKARAAEAAEQAAREQAAREKAAQQKLAQEKAARERAERERAAQDKAAQDKARAAQAARDKAARERREAAERAAEEQRLEAQRQENLKRLMAQAGGSGGSGRPGSTGTAARDAAPSASYAGVLREHVRSRVAFNTDGLPRDTVAVVEIRATSTGTVLARRLVKSSGNAAYDEALLRAVDRASPLPRDANGTVPPTLELIFRPFD